MYAPLMPMPGSGVPSFAPQQQAFNAYPGNYTPRQLQLIINLQRWWRFRISREYKMRRTLQQALHLAMGDGDGEDENDRNMDTKYWIEAADPKHRYGSQLYPYYREWVASGTTVGFFKWLDKGKGKDLDLEECPREKLERSSVTYFTAKERAEWEVEFVQDEEGNVLCVWKNDSSDGDHEAGDLVDTPGRKYPLCCYSAGLPTKYIYVVDADNRLYTHPKKTGFFHHSSFLSGGIVHAAGGLVIEDGELLVVNGSSGHYKPSTRMLESLFGFYEEEYGLDPSSYRMVHPRTRKVCGPCSGFLCFKKIPPIPSNFPC